MTRTRKLKLCITAASLLVVVVIALTAVLVARRNEPVIAGRFLRYDNGGETAVVQITNLSKVTVRCILVPVPLQRDTRSYHGFFDGDSSIIETRQGAEFQVPVIDGARRASHLTVVYLASHGALHRRLSAILKSSGIGLTDKPSELSLALPPPQTPLP